jgi:riboflavin kinase/FMN adenylyltransferase
VKIIRNLSEFPSTARGGAVAVGNFDGVHLGHARIVKRLGERAAAVGGPAIVLTFDPHPVRLLRPESCPPPLTWTERKGELLAELDVDWMIAYPTDRALLSLGPEEFFRSFLVDALAAAAMVEGPNFYFGRDRTGTIDRLAEWSVAAGISLDVVEPYVLDGEFISSSRVRAAILAGRVEEASRMLTRPYRVRGMVVHGANRGADLGFPTANLGAIDTLRPAAGVYAGRAYRNGDVWPAAINVGAAPTFGATDERIEVHLIGRRETLYGQPLEVDFLVRLRDIQAFASREELIAQLQRDVAQTSQVCSQRHGE